MVRMVLSSLAILLCLALPARTARGESDPLIFIVNADSPVASISSNDIRDYFFKRKRTWPDGTGVRFIDRSSGSPIRQEFMRSYLRKDADDLDMYWIGQKLYSGDSAPLQEPSDAMTIRFVENFHGAIGYISSTADLSGHKVKTVKVEP